MLRRANINWNAKQLAKMIEKDTITFDNVVQRGLVWDVNRKSLLIHSMIMGYPIPPFYAAKNDTKYDMLDGKQRCHAIKEFINNEYELAEVPVVIMEDGTECELNGMRFEQLPEDIQDLITSYSLTIYYFDGISDEEITEMFFRLNNGKPLSSIELTRVASKSLGTIRELGQHNFFKETMSNVNMKKYANEDTVIRAYIMLTEDEPALDTKTIRKITGSQEITEQDKLKLSQIFDRFLDMYKGTADKKLKKKLATRTHLVSLVPMIWRSIDEGESIDKVMDWFKGFYGTENGASVDEEYNSCCITGSAKKENIAVRLDALEHSYDEYFISVDESSDESSDENSITEAVAD